MTGAGAKSCEHCAQSCQYTPADECREYNVHGDNYWLCDPCAKAGAPKLKPEPDFGEAPSNSTDTSQQSARQSDKDVTPQCYLILGVLAAAPGGLIREEISERAGVVNQAVCARLNTLEKRGLVRVDGEKRMAGTRRLQQVYHYSGRAS